MITIASMSIPLALRSADQHLYVLADEHQQHYPASFTTTVRVQKRINLASPNGMLEVTSTFWHAGMFWNLKCKMMLAPMEHIRLPRVE
ncbi:unnamed protein product [Brugia pahangi]|uniref:Secreted protein n=1 Tax=Brugia pahangi TaxID=6280 RepID=A0A0N4TAP7_BRUPA|nr:unnamed protein product [Brugia pahangi]